MRDRALLTVDRCHACGAPLAFGRECYAVSLHSMGADAPASRGPLGETSAGRVGEAQNTPASHRPESELSVSFTRSA